jgi:hypothetical protein
MKYFQRIDEDCAIAAQLTPAQIGGNAEFGQNSTLRLKATF